MSKTKHKQGFTTGMYSDKELAAMLLNTNFDISQVSQETGIAITVLFKSLKTKIAEKLLECYEEHHMKATEIGRLLNIRRHYVNDWTIACGLQAARERARNWHLYDKRIVMAYIKLLGIKEVGRMFNIGPKKVKECLAYWGIVIVDNPGIWTKIVKHVLKVDYNKPLSDSIIRRLPGLLLGDLNLRMQISKKTKPSDYPPRPSIPEYLEARDFLKSSQMIQEDNITTEFIEKFNVAIAIMKRAYVANFRVHKGIDEKPWVEHQSKLLNDSGYENDVFIKDKAKPSANGNDKTVGFDTKSSIQLQEWFDQWYAGENDEKCVPRELVLTPDTLLLWHAGDGSVNKNSVYMSTNSFTEADCEFLVKLLKRDVGIESKVRLTVDGYIINISTVKANLKIFFDYLKQAEDYEIVKKTMPWRFDVNLLKRDVISDK